MVNCYHINILLENVFNDIGMYLNHDSSCFLLLQVKQQFPHTPKNPMIKTAYIQLPTGVSIHPGWLFKYPQYITAPTISHAKLKIEYMTKKIAVHANMRSAHSKLMQEIIATMSNRPIKANLSAPSTSSHVFRGNDIFGTGIVEQASPAEAQTISTMMNGKFRQVITPKMIQKNAAEAPYIFKQYEELKQKSINRQADGLQKRQKRSIPQQSEAKSQMMIQN